MLFGCSLSQINHIVAGHLQCAASSRLYAASGGQKRNCDSRNFVSFVTCYVDIRVLCTAALNSKIPCIMYVQVITKISKVCVTYTTQFIFFYGFVHSNFKFISLPSQRILSNTILLSLPFSSIHKYSILVILQSDWKKHYRYSSYQTVLIQLSYLPYT